MRRQTCFEADAVSGNITYKENCELGFSGISDEAACLAKGQFWKTHYEHFSGGQLSNLVSPPPPPRLCAYRFFFSSFFYFLQR